MHCVNNLEILFTMIHSRDDNPAAQTKDEQER